MTESSSFGGAVEDLLAARAGSGLPILRKDFVVDPYQVYETAVAGADALLLIVAALGHDELHRLHAEALALDLDVLVEVHSDDELECALEVIDADVIGINNRDLGDFSVDIERTYELLSDVPAGKAVVSESGFSTREQRAALVAARPPDDVEKRWTVDARVGSTRAGAPTISCAEADSGWAATRISSP